MSGSQEQFPPEQPAPKPEPGKPTPMPQDPGNPTN